MQKLTSTWRQQKPSFEIPSESISSNKDAGLKVSQGKRRLGRFPISATSVIVNKSNWDKSSLPVENNHCAAKADLQASFSSSFSASLDSDLVLEAEKIEAALNVKTKKADSKSKSSPVVEDPSLLPPANISNVRISALAHNSLDISLKEVTTLHQRAEDIKQGTGKRKYVKSTPTSVSGKKLTSIKPCAFLELSHTPTSSPVDKRLKHSAITEHLLCDVHQNTDVQPSKHSDFEMKTPVSKEKVNLLSKVNSAEKLNISNISFSPLCSTPGGSAENVCDLNITDEESSEMNVLVRRNLNFRSFQKDSPFNKVLSKATSGANMMQVNNSKLTSIQPEVIHHYDSPTRINSSNSPLSHSHSKSGSSSSTVNTTIGKKRSSPYLGSSSPVVTLTRRGRKSTLRSSSPKKPTQDETVIKKSAKNNSTTIKNTSVKKESKIQPASTSVSKIQPASTSVSKIQPTSTSVSKKRPSSRTVRSMNSVDKINLSPQNDKHSQGNADLVPNGKGSNTGTDSEKNLGASSVISTSFTLETSVNTSLTQDKRQLSSWGLPHPVLEAYKNQGVTTMFEWQAECLLTAHVLEGGNLVYSAPTSAGKTLVAELLVLKRVVETRKKALIILPFVSVAREKMYSLQRLYQDAGIRVGGYMGSYSPAGGLSSVDVAVCTIEKGNGLINRLMEEGKLGDLGAVVVDELHMVGDSHRGYLLELMLTKLAYITHRATNGNAESKVQIIGMSATLPNLQLLATWLKASLYHTDYRPVPLTEYLKIDNKILDGQLLVQREIPALLTFPDDQDHVTALCLETVRGGHAALIFCPTKIWCENLCESVARKFYAIISENTKAELQERKDDGGPIVTSGILITLDREGLMETVEQLRRCPVGADPMLARCVLNGVAYHHAGLTFDERDIIEGAFRQGHLKVLIATSTLSSGVNLPARRVIIRTPMFHGKLIDTLTYKQMAGRAGRKGVDTQGESILICKAQEKAKATNLLKSELPAVESCLQFNVKEGLSSSLKRAVLEIVVSGVAAKAEDVVTYIDCTLLSVSLEGNGLCQVKTALVESCIKYLQENEFVTVQVSQKEDGSDTNKFYPTQLGAAILASSLSPDEGLLVFAELQKARRAFALDTELHTIYLVTPVYTSDVSSSIDWFHYHNLWENLTPADRRVAELVGVSESFIGKALSGRLGKTESARKALGVHQRFYTALVLNYLVQETPIMEVAAKFNCNKGQLQSLQQSASTYAGMVTVFCGRLGWHNLELLLSQFQKRLSCGVQQELVDLVRIEALNASSARMLYNAGYHTVADVARADAVDVENLFKKAAPFQSEKKQDGETDWELKERRRARCIWLTGRKGVTEMDAALVIIEEAKVIIQGELGVNRISWGSKDQSHSDEESDSEDGSDPRNTESLDGTDTAQSRNDPVEKHLDSNAAYVCGDQVDTNLSHQTESVTANLPCSSSSHLNERQMNIGEQVSSKVDSLQESGRGNLKLGKENLPAGCKTVTPNSFDAVRMNMIKSLNSSRGGNVHKRKGGDKYMKSPNQSLKRGKSGEKSFFGQVVVSPPVSIRTTTSQIRRQSNLMDSPVMVDSLDATVMVVNIRDATATDANITDATATDANIRDATAKDINIRDATAMDINIREEHSEEKQPQVNRSSTEENVDTSEIRDGFPAQKSCKANSVKDVTTMSDHSRHTVTIQDGEWTTGNSINDDKNKPSSSSGPMDSILSRSVPVDESSGGFDSFSFNESIVLDTQTEILINQKRSGAVLNQSEPNAPAMPVSRCQGDSVGNIGMKDCKQSKTTSVESVVSQRCQQRGQSNPCSSLACSQSPDPFLDSFSEGVINNCKKRQSTTPKNHPILRTGEDNADKVFSESLFDSAEKLSPRQQKVNQVCKQADFMDSTHSVNIPFIRDDSDVENEAQKSGVTGHELDDPISTVSSDSEDGESLIAASNYERLIHLDDGAMDEVDDLNSSYADLHIICNSQASHRLQGVKSKAESNETFQRCAILHEKTERNAGSLSPDGSYALGEEDLMAALQMSDSFNVSPVITQIPQNLHGKVPQNSTPKIPLGTRSVNLRIGTLDRNSNKAEITPINKKKNAPVGVVASCKNNRKESPQDEFFQDSFSSSLMDKVIAECEGLAKEHRPIEELKTTGHNELETNMKGTGISGNSGRMEPSSNDSSRNDGSDCVPPTPPNEAASLVSPFKFSFYSPLRPKVPKTLEHSDAKPGGTEPFTIIKERNKKICTENQSIMESLNRLEQPTRINNRLEQPTRINNRLEQPTRINNRLEQPTWVNSVKESISRAGNKITKSPLGEKCVEQNLGTAAMKGKLTVESRQTETNDSTDDSTDDMCDVGDQSHAEHNQAMASQLLSQQSFTVIDVCANRILFETFLKEWKVQPSYSLSLACEKKPAESVRRSSTGIGGKFLKKAKSPRIEESSHVSGIPIPDTGSILIGLSVSWENRDSYYISLMPTDITAEVDPNDTLAEPPLDDSLSQNHRIQSVFQVLDSNLGQGASKQTVAIYDAKMAYNYLAKALGIALAHCEDPRVADWLREPTARLKNLHRMVAAHCPEELPLLDAVGGVSGYHGMGTDIKSKISGRLRASTESVLTMKLISKYHTMLAEEHLLDALLDVEMPSLITLARMELNGFGVSETEFESQKTVMTTKLTVLEEQAYKMAGHVFSLTSTDDVAKILYIELKLPINGDPTIVPHLPTRGTRGRRTTIGSTSKEVLEKLQKFHPLPAIILEWRRISSALTKSLFALQNAARLCPKLDMSRVFSECQIFTATGRVSMAEPNLQNVPKDFSIQLPDFIGESPPTRSSRTIGITKGGQTKLAQIRGDNRQEAKIIDPDNLVTAPISMRKLFIPFKGGVILAADYSQLELRIICHLSGDVKLANILNAADGDVFNMIAAQMKGIPLEEVTSDHRQQAKQVCYGMLYGIGPKALGEQLGVDENDAGAFMETFKSRYQGIRKYLRETVEFCQKNGYVKTIFNRRRYLPSIRNSNPNARAQAERQAVNTTIQGSAADLVKIAMSNIDRKLMQLFPMTRNCHSQVSRDPENAPTVVRGAFLVLQLHDELIYEVSANQVAEVARLVKNEMEVAVKLNVCMPVKVKVGPSWGQLCEYNVQ